MRIVLRLFWHDIQRDLQARRWQYLACACVGVGTGLVGVPLHVPGIIQLAFVVVICAGIIGLPAARVRIRAWWGGNARSWCTYSHHWTSQPLPWPKPSHYSHWFCNQCFHKWLDSWEVRV